MRRIALFFLALCEIWSAGSQGLELSIKEDAAVGDAFLLPTIGNTTDTVSEKKNVLGYFDVVQNGSIILKKPVDYEQQRKFTFDVTVTKSGSIQSESCGSFDG